MALTLRRPGSRNQIAEADSREERKYPFPAARASLLTAWLDARLPRDPQYPVGIVTSCYYDTPQLDAYQESADGELRKQKLRLRWYGEPIDPYAGVWLEIKTRDGVRSSKQRYRYPISGAANALGLAIPRRRELAAWLTELSASVGAPLDPTMEPTALVRYGRIRWQSSDRQVRAALDTEVCAAAPSGAPIWLPIPDGSVLELKSAGDLPPQMEQLGRLGLRRTAHSKYALAVERLYGGDRPPTR
ncbi:MAG: polyphosphate polymerase domain-containing protein [Gemmatimonadetes bacterium]|nr:polyphosphate polymerase domain-containing protein [Chloroflexota bacterium]MYE16549.1 polyphosphate polymerase domain-containing protein [Gemmatimonadota bacterium]MYF80276.1 polyphosphate polymerase domain-containing protein [Chloroflexota bacterium]MYI03900.1 polyphosphate polymerase domain-containing protein [Chloroflexota bacterium]